MLNIIQSLNQTKPWVYNPYHMSKRDVYCRLQPINYQVTQERFVLDKAMRTKLSRNPALLISKTGLQIFDLVLFSFCLQTRF